jgi:hypothetical protein
VYPRFGVVLSLIPLVIFGVCLGLVPSARATEPDGWTVLRYQWLPEGSSPAGESILRVSIRAVVPLEDAWFAFEAPSGVLAGISRLNAEILGRTAVRSTLEVPHPLGSLNAGQTVIVDLTVLAPETVRGILALRFGATNPHGKSITEGDGVPIGLLGREPVRRLEAVEFPAGTAQEAAR